MTGSNVYLFVRTFHVASILTLIILINFRLGNMKIPLEIETFVEQLAKKRATGKQYTIDSSND